MLSILINLILLLIILAILWWIVSLVPKPAGFPVWIIQVLFALVFLICFLSVLFGGFSLYPFGHPLLR
jgi:hypothetical protein